MSFTCRAITRDLHGKYLHLTRENTRDTMRRISRVCKVVVELYRSITAYMYVLLLILCGYPWWYSPRAATFKHG